MVKARRLISDMSPKLPLMSAALSLLALLSSAGAATYTLAVVGPMSGVRASYGTELQRTVEMAVKDRSAELRAAGIDLKVVAFDDQASAQTGRQVAPSILADSNVIGVVGALNSSVSTVLGTLFAPAQLAMVSPSSTNDGLTQQRWGHFNRVVAPDQAQSVAAAAYIADTLKAKRVYLVSDNTAYGNGLSKSVMANLKARQVAIAAYAGASTPTQIAAVVRQIKSSGVGVVFFGGTEEVGAPLVRAMRAAGVKAVFMAGDGLDGAQFLRQADKAAIGVTYTTVFGPVESFSNSLNFATNFRKAYNLAPTSAAPYMYDSALAMIEAVKTSASAGTTTRTKVAQALRRVNLPACFAGQTSDCLSITGAVAFSATGERSRSKVLIMKVDNSFQIGVAKIQTINADQLK